MCDKICDDEFALLLMFEREFLTIQQYERSLTTPKIIVKRTTNAQSNKQRSTKIDELELTLPCGVSVSSTRCIVSLNSPNFVRTVEYRSDTPHLKPLYPMLFK